MARNFQPEAAEPGELLRLAAQFTWCCGSDLRIDSVVALDPDCPGAVLGTMRGARLDRLADKALYPAERRILAERISQRSDFVDTALTLAGDDATTLHVSLSASGIRDQAGRFIGYRGIGRAGSERPYDALQRQELAALLRRAEAARDREARLRRESEALLASLQCLQEPLPIADKCRAILGTFKPVLDYEVALVVRRGMNGTLSAVACTLQQSGQQAGEILWPQGTLIAGALAGQASMHEDISRLIDQATFPSSLAPYARAALFAPLRIGREHAVIVAMHSRPGAFAETHIAALQRLGLVAEQAFETEESKLAIVNTSKLATLGEMFATIAHEVNQPLSVISMAAQNARLMIDSDAPAHELADKLDRIGSQARRAGDIVKAIRKLAHPGHAGAAVTDVALEEVMQGLTVLCEGSFRNQGIALDVTLPAPCPAVRAHLSGLEQVLLNLTTNARDAVTERMERDGQMSGGRVVVEVDVPDDGEQVRIRVSDNGGGIPEDVIERIFDPFFTLKEVGKGTGLGLSICQTLLADMKATIDVRNGADGAVFEIRLPAAAS